MLIHRLRNWVALLAISTGAAYPACSTKAVGVEECRQVEYARCEAAPNCPGQFDVTDVEQCKLYYRDHCLHGLPVSSAPTGSAVKQCIDTIRDLAKCAAKQEGAAALLTDCSLSDETTNPKITKACKLLAAPESITACSSFLTADSSSGEGGSSSDGGKSSTGGTTSAQGGSSGLGGLTL